jgi:hypothetical protein
MRTKQPAKSPVALSAASERFNQWRSRHRKRTRLPKELWRQAAGLAGEHGLNKTARALGLDYYSLKKHLEQMTTEELIPAKAEANFIELLGGAMTPGLIECTIEWTDGGDSTVRMHIKGAGLSELASLAGVFRSSQA